MKYNLLFLKSAGNSMFHDFLALVFPQYCKICKEILYKREKHICTPCLFNLPKTQDELFIDRNIEKKFWGRINVKYVFTYLQFKKNNATQKLLYCIKYKEDVELAHLIGFWFGTELSVYRFNQSFDLIIPVPLHKKKLKKRGYNQTELICSGLSQALKIPVIQNSAFIKKAHNESQTRKGRYERWLNVEDLYYVTEPEVLKDKRILLVDDIITTGATLEAAGQALLNAGARNLSIAAIANAT